MPLVEYSDSEGSDDESTKTIPQQPATLPPNPNSALNFAVDKSNPRKIRVNIQEARVEPSTFGGVDGEPIPKRARIGGGGFSGFNSFLPAPKRDAQAANGGNATKSTPRKVFSLKTGAEPGFSREADAELRQQFAERGQSSNDEDMTWTSTDTAATAGGTPAEAINTSNPPKSGNAMMFKPLSVARNPKKKKPSAPAFAPSAASASKVESQASTEGPTKGPAKLSLFSFTGDQKDPVASANSYYEPLVYDGSTSNENNDVAENLDDSTFEVQESTIGSVPTPAVPVATQSLDTIASDLNLSASARRQLFGREGKSLNAVNIVNFNTDQEYAANEVLRQTGEQVQHNPLRAIAPGKHSLKQLVSAASGQKEALEESFAAGRRNKKEAGSKYGW